MSKVEYISPEGLRVDGRRTHEIRRLNCNLGLFPKADGSAYLEQGNTKVVASVFGPREPSNSGRMSHDKAVVTCEFRVATFARGERKTRGASDRRNQEAAYTIQQIFESLVLTHLFPRSEIILCVEVLADDGGARNAAINATTLALIDAGVPMSDFVCSCAVGWIDGRTLLDLNNVEESAGGPDLIVAVQPKTEKIAMVQMDSKLPITAFEEATRLAIEGCRQIFDILKTSVRDYVVYMADSRGLIE